MLLCDDSPIENLFYCALACYKTCLQFLSLCLESAENNSEHDLAGMADQADGKMMLTSFEVAFSW